MGVFFVVGVRYQLTSQPIIILSNLLVFYCYLFLVLVLCS